MGSYGGLIELLVVFGFVLGWGVLELVGLRLDKKRAREQGKREQAEPAEAEQPHPPLPHGARHPERKQRLDPS
jgi:hypothetical protein